MRKRVQSTNFAEQAKNPLNIPGAFKARAVALKTSKVVQNSKDTPEKQGCLYTECTAPCSP